MRTIDYKIDDYVGEVERLEKEIRELQIRFNALAETREISLMGVRTVTWTAAYAASPNRLLRLSIVS